MTEDISNSSVGGVDIKASLVLDRLKSALLSLERVVSSRSTLPILNNILVKIDKSGVELVATNLEIGVRLFVGGKVEGEGVLTVPGKPFITLINSLHGETVDLATEGFGLLVSCGEVKAQINGTSAEDYPELPEVSSQTVLKLSGGKFKQLLSVVDFAVSRDESRQILTGIYIEVEGKKLTLVATDSYRLSEVVDDISEEKSFKIIVPSKTLAEVKRLLSDGRDVELRVEESQVMFAWENAQIISRVIEGTYPPYKQILPAEPVITAEVDVKEMVDTLKSATVFSMEVGSSVRLRFKDGEPLKVFSEFSQLGNFSAEVESEIRGGEEEVSFNSRYVLDGLENMDTPRCLIGVTSKTGAVSFRPIGEENRIYIVMPLRS